MSNIPIKYYTLFPLAHRSIHSQTHAYARTYAHGHTHRRTRPRAVTLSETEHRHPLRVLAPHSCPSGPAWLRPGEGAAAPASALPPSPPPVAHRGEHAQPQGASQRARRARGPAHRSSRPGRTVNRSTGVLRRERARAPTARELPGLSLRHSRSTGALPSHRTTREDVPRPERKPHPHFFPSEKMKKHATM